MSTPIPRIGVLTYESSPGTVAVGVMSKSEINIEPIYDTAERTTTSNKYTLSVQMTVDADGETVDDTIADLRKILTTPGGRLQATGVGYGENIRINMPGGQDDVRWGPKPRHLRVTPLGGAMAVSVNWTVEWEIKECERDPRRGLEFMELTFTVGYRIDRSGLTTRSISGQARIPQTRKTPDARGLVHTADQMRSRLTGCFPAIAGFRRESQEYSLTADKCGINFSITDVELPYQAPPEGIIEVRASHEIASQSIPNSAATVWAGRLSAMYEVERGRPREMAHRLFQKLLADRTPAGDALDRLIRTGLDERIFRLARQVIDNKNFLVPVEDQELVKVAQIVIKGAALILRQITLGEPDIYGKAAAQFSAYYTFCCPMDHVMEMTGLWSVVSNSGGGLWVSSLSNSAYNVRGLAKQGHGPKADVIIDLCDPVKIDGKNANLGTPPNTTRELRTINSRPKGRQVLGYRNKIPDPEVSWWVYDAQVTIETDDETIIMKPLPRKARDVSPLEPKRSELRAMRPIQTDDTGTFRAVDVPGDAKDPAKTFTDIPQDNVPSLRPYKHVPRDLVPIIQMRAAPTVYVRFSGMALRWGYSPGIPEIKSVGGMDVVPCNRSGREFTSLDIVENAFGVELYRAQWNLRYVLTGIPKTVEIPKPPTK